MRRSLVMSALVCLAATCRAEDVSQADLLNRLLDFDRLTRPPADDERLLLFSSFDRASQNTSGKDADWNANRDSNQFASKKDGWDVWAQAEGPGAAARIWCDKLAGEIQIVVDGKKVVAAPLGDFFKGAVEPFGEPLSYVVTRGDRHAGVCCFPIGFQKSLVVQTRGFDGAYQVDAAKFAAGTRVQPFTAELDAGTRKAVQAVARAFKNGIEERQLMAARGAGAAGDEAPKPVRLATYAVQADLIGKQKQPPRRPKPKEGEEEEEPTHRLEVRIPAPPSEADPTTTKPAGPGDDKKKPADPTKKPGTIRALYAAITDKFEPRDKYALHNLILRITFDDAPQPQVEAPLVDFFGTGFQRSSFDSLPIGTERLVPDFPGENVGESVFLYCFFPMPFHKNALIEVENLNTPLRRTETIGVMLYAKVDPTPPARDALLFNARFRQEAPCKTFDFSLLETAGRGRIVGCVLNVDCPREDWWGEGDHKAWIDGEAFPSIFGTGTADYFGNTAGLTRSAAALSGVTAVSPHGKNSCYRWHVLDAIPYHKSVKLALENWQVGKAQDVSYGAVTYWYAQTGATPKNFERLEAEDLKLAGLRIPGSVELEGNIEGKDWGAVLKQRDARVELSGEAAATISTTEPVTVTVRVAKAGRYRLKVRAVPGSTFETIAVSNSADKPIGTVKYEKKPDSTFEVGTVDFAVGENRLKLRCSKTARLDCWILESTDAAKN